MEALFIEASGVIEQISNLFCQLEKRIGHKSEEISYEENIKEKIDGLNSTFDRLELYILKEHPSKRQTSRLRLNQLKYDATHLNASLHNFQKSRYRREREYTDREELLNRRFTTNETNINIDHSLHHHSSLQNANSNMDDMINQGYHILTNLQDQKSVLKKTQKRILDFKNTLNLSNTVMRFIERRAYQDKFVLFGGMLITFIIIFFIYFYFI